MLFHFDDDTETQKERMKNKRQGDIWIILHFLSKNILKKY